MQTSTNEHEHKEGPGTDMKRQRVTASRLQWRLPQESQSQRGLLERVKGLSPGKGRPKDCEEQYGKLVKEREGLEKEINSAFKQYSQLGRRRDGFWRGLKVPSLKPM